MKKFTFLFTLICSVFWSFAQTNGDIVFTQRVIFPGFHEKPEIKNYYDSTAYSNAIKDKSFRTDKIIYFSDSLKVVAYLSSSVMKPKKKYPLIIFNRGSYTRNDISYVYAPLFQKLVQSGFIVLAPALRESEGGEGKDEMGGNDQHDIFNLLPLISRLPYADSSKIFMLGESRGGIMTYLCIKNKFPLRAAAVTGGISDMEKYITDDFPAGDKIFSRIYPDYTSQRHAILSSRSAINWPDSFNVPVLIMHGQADRQVKPVYALNLAGKLADAGKPFQLFIFEGGNHMLSGKHAEERDKQVIEWFRKHF